MFSNRFWATAFIAAILVNTLIFLMAAPVGAAKPTTGLVLDFQYSQYSPCWSDNEVHWRSWGGSLAPGESLNVDELLCADPGGLGLIVRASSKLRPLTLTLTPPSGPSVVGIIQQGKGFAETRGCIVSLWDVGSNTYLNSVEGGLYAITVANTTSSVIQNVSIDIFVKQAWPIEQTGECPVQHQELVP